MQAPFPTEEAVGRDTAPEDAAAEASTPAADVIVVLATGGTIAGLAHGDGSDRYTAAQVGVQALLGGVPVPAGCRVEAEQVAQIDSKDMSHAVWRDLALRCRHHLGRNAVIGVVVTHGTDTMEETACFLDRVLAPVKPIVLTGAMRPADAADADGPSNLADALVVAREAPPGGAVVVVMGGEVHAAERVRKRHPTALRAFASDRPFDSTQQVQRQGAGESAAVLATVINAHLHIVEPHWPRRIPAALSILEAEPDSWPRVGIVASHAGLDAELIAASLEAMAAQGLDGLVVECTGNGTRHVALEPALTALATRGVVIRRVSRCASAPIRGDNADTWPAATVSTAGKARVELMVDLAQQRAVR